MQIHVVDSFFGLLEVRFVTIFLYSGEARGLVFWAMDPVWSPPQAPGGSVQGQSQGQGQGQDQDHLVLQRAALPLYLVLALTLTLALTLPWFIIIITKNGHERDF